MLFFRFAENVLNASSKCIHCEGLLQPLRLSVLIICLKCPLLSHGTTSNLAVHKGEFHQRRQSSRRVFKQMAEMEES